MCLIIKICFYITLNLLLFIKIFFKNIIISIAFSNILFDKIFWIRPYMHVWNIWMLCIILCGKLLKMKRYCFKNWIGENPTNMMTKVVTSTIFKHCPDLVNILRIQRLFWRRWWCELLSPRWKFVGSDSKSHIGGICFSPYLGLSKAINFMF